MSSNKTAYTLHGRGGQTLVLIHGVGLNQHVWQPQIDYFAARYRVLAYDMLGHGDSHLPSSTPTLTDYTDQLLQLINQLEVERIAIVGHSMGALISVAFALAHPQRVAALVPMNIVYRRTVKQREAVIGRAEKVLAHGAITGIDKTLQRWFADKTTPNEMLKIETVGNWMAAADPMGYGRTYRLFAESDNAFMGRLQHLTMPILYLTGENDPNSTPKMSAEMSAETPQGQVAIVPDEAHMMAYISPQKVNPLIAQFLQETV